MAGSGTGTDTSVFDPDLAGQSALDAARPCLSPDSLAAGVQIGASLLFPRTDGVSRRVYFGATQNLTPDEKRCVSDALIGISAGGPPPRNTVVVYSFWFDTRGGKFRGKVKEPVKEPHQEPQAE